MNVKPATMFIGDNLPVLRGMDSEIIDLIYLDPPFNSKKQWSAPIGSEAAGAAFKDTWTLSDIDKEDIKLLKSKYPEISRLINTIGMINGNGDKSYLLMMATRLIEMQRILKPTGSIFLHCDPTMSHSLKLLMDSIFVKRGGGEFSNEIIWCYPPKGNPPKHGFHKKHDVILYYRARENHGVFVRPYTELNAKQIAKFSLVDEDGRKYKEFKGRRTYLDESRGRPVPCWWTDIAQTGQSRIEYNGYPTQNPLALLERIVKSCTNEGDLVLDPFSGCATACIAAEKLNRKWIGIDFSEKAVELVLLRFMKELELLNPNIIERRDIPVQSDVSRRSTNLYTSNRSEFRKSLYGTQSGNCAGCDTHFPNPRHFHLDHIIPKSDGGGDEDSNIQLLCGSCNSIKGNRSMAYLKAELKKVNERRRK